MRFAVVSSRQHRLHSWTIWSTAELSGAQLNYLEHSWTIWSTAELSGAQLNYLEHSWTIWSTAESSGAQLNHLEHSWTIWSKQVAIECMHAWIVWKKDRIRTCSGNDIVASFPQSEHGVMGLSLIFHRGWLNVLAEIVQFRHTPPPVCASVKVQITHASVIVD